MRVGTSSRYDAQNSVLNTAYGALADLRRELADSKAAVAERTELLQLFATCADSQRAWLLLEDYFGKLSLARRDFPGNHWWPRLLGALGKGRLEETALLFLRNNRAVPTELTAYANPARLAEIEQAEQEQKQVEEMEEWLLPPAPTHLDSPRAHLRVAVRAIPSEREPGFNELGIEFLLYKPRSGEKPKTVAELIDHATRAAHEEELFPNRDWQCIIWVRDYYRDRPDNDQPLRVAGLDLLHWLARWGSPAWFEWAGTPDNVVFTGQLAELAPRIENGDQELTYLHKLRLSTGEEFELDQVKWFAGQPALVAVHNAFYLLRNAPSPSLLAKLVQQPGLAVRKLSHRLITHLRKSGSTNGTNWDDICVAHKARPQFLFELEADTVRLRLLAVSERDNSRWQWNGHEWQPADDPPRRITKPEILDDARLEKSATWLRRLDWFTPEPGLWVGDASDNFLGMLAMAWPDRPDDADYLANQAFQRLFMAPRQLKPKLIVQGSGIDWLSVSAEWEQEGLKLTAADL